MYILFNASLVKLKMIFMNLFLQLLLFQFMTSLFITLVDLKNIIFLKGKRIVVMQVMLLELLQC